MLVYKFGGASIATPDRMKALWPILAEATAPLVIVISAIGKTTNALEEIVQAACRQETQLAHELADRLEKDHLAYAEALLSPESYQKAKEGLNEFFTELQWAVDGADASRFDYSYDQIVCLGELLSTRLAYYCFSEMGMKLDWVDVRDVIRTDDTYRDGRVDWDFSRQQAGEIIGNRLKEGKSVITQGFIGATADNNSVTLGREGSDYTAAMMAAMLEGRSVTIWKDVEGLQNADPKKFPNTVKIEAISYHEVIEMAYYGAQVIHPKTIKPLQNNNIPLFVKCFLNKDLKGTEIRNEVNSIFYPPLIVLKQNQTLLQVTAKDFSFITEDNLSRLYKTFHDLKIRINLIQNAAISFVACVDDSEEQIQALIRELEQDYSIFRNENVSLLTIRHYTPEILFDLTKGKYILLEQKTRHTVQVIIK